MSWSERQRALLDAMGLRLWDAPAAAAAPAPSPAPAAAGAPVSIAQAEPPTPRALTAEPAASPRVQQGPSPTPGLIPDAGLPALGLEKTLAGSASAQPSFAAPAPIVAREADPRRDAIAQLDWDGLARETAACRACGLCEARRQAVLGVGAPRAALMLIGEGPGEQEDAQGEPFVGESGRLLDAILRAGGHHRQVGVSEAAEAGAARQPVYIANAVKCRPPRNRNPSPDELAACRPFLMRQIALVQPRVIVLLGRVAVQSVLGREEPLGKLRGHVHRLGEVPVIVTYHPAYLLRNLPEKARAWQDWCLALDTLEGLSAKAGMP